MEKLVKYLRENNAGLIVTHGSIFDEVYWKDCKRENAEKIGARGQVGDKPEVYLDKDKETIALTIGLYPMPLFEFLRDQAAETVCSEDEKAGRALGSTPLAVPYVPFSGNLIVEEEHPIFKGIKLNEKNQFHVNIPSAYNEVGVDAYTLVGWQYVLPTDIPKVVKERAEIARDKAENYLEEISKFIQEFTGKKVESSYLLEGVEGEISKGLSKLNIENNIASFEINSKEYKFSLDNEVVKELASKIPAKAIALSDDLLAGIAVNDEWYREDGHRTVYFSFELEASNSEITEKLLKNSIEWVSKFEYRPLNLMGVRKFVLSMIAKASSGVVSSSNVDLAIALSVFKELPTSKELGIQILLGSAGKPEGVEFTKDTLTYKGKTFKSSWGKEDYAIIQRIGDKVNIVGTHRFGTKAGLLYYQKYKPMGTIIIHWKDENNDGKVEIEEVEKVI